MMHSLDHKLNNHFTGYVVLKDPAKQVSSLQGEFCGATYRVFVR